MANYELAGFNELTETFVAPGVSDNGVITNLLVSGEIDFSSPSATRTNLGLQIGVNVQGYDEELSEIAALVPVNDDFMQYKSGAWANRTVAQVVADLVVGGVVDLTTAQTLTGKTIAYASNTLTGVQPSLSGLAVTPATVAGTDKVLLQDADDSDNLKTATAQAIANLAQVNNANWSGTDLAVDNGGTGASDAATARTNLGVAIGVNVQAYDADLAAIAALTPTTNDFIVYGASAWEVKTPAQVLTLIGAGTGDGTVTSVGGTGTVNGLTLTGTVTASGNLTLGGTLSISNADWSGTDLAVANGGTGASDAAGAKTNLGFMTDVVDDTTPQLGGNLDLNAKGIVQVFTAATGNNFTIGQIGQVNTSNEMVLADASAYSTASGLLGMATGTINAGASGQFLLLGYITGLSGLTAGVQFLSETAGAMTTTAPSTASAGVRVLGYAPTSSTMWFQTSPNVVVI